MRKVESHDMFFVTCHSGDGSGTKTQLSDTRRTKSLTSDKSNSRTAMSAPVVPDNALLKFKSKKDCSVIGHCFMITWRAIGTEIVFKEPMNWSLTKRKKFGSQLQASRTDSVTVRATCTCMTNTEASIEVNA